MAFQPPPRQVAPQTGSPRLPGQEAQGKRQEPRLLLFVTMVQLIAQASVDGAQL